MASMIRSIKRKAHRKEMVKEHGTIKHYRKYLSEKDRTEREGARELASKKQKGLFNSIKAQMKRKTFDKDFSTRKKY